MSWICVVSAEKSVFFVALLAAGKNESTKRWVDDAFSYYVENVDHFGDDDKKICNTHKLPEWESNKPKSEKSTERVNWW